MSTLATSTLTDSIVELLTEAYAGPPDPRTTWFIDNEPDAGILGLLATVSAAEASKSVHPNGDSGSTIAAHAEHLRWSLANANGALRGQAYQSNWNESWQLLDADEEQWNQLRQAIRAEFESISEAIKRQEELPGPYLNGLLALIPHAAYHLGTIRQMIERVRG